MDIVFWNIGVQISQDKLDLVESIISDNSPDIFCICEGTPSRKDCIDLNNTFNANKYEEYVTPTSLERIGFSYLDDSLKLYVKKGTYKPFEIGKQTHKGRVVLIQSIVDNYNLLFLHNYSKGGIVHNNDSQVEFFAGVKFWLNQFYSNIDHNQFVFIGDFNLEPWDSFNRKNFLLKCSFWEKDLMINNRVNGRKNKVYFNPAFEHIAKSNNLNLNGTYYNKNYGWAFFDYPIYNSEKYIVKYEVITSVNSGQEILKSNTKIKTDFLKKNIDHLPIKVNIQKK